MAYLIGAGPGDPRLLTLRAVDALVKADVVLVDELVHPEVLVHARRARIVHVGKRGGRPSVAQEVSTRMLVDAVRRGEIVVRLKGGDPFVFGRGGEEAEALAHAGLSFEVVPGVTSALGAAAYAGIPLTHRGVASSVVFVAGHEEGRVSEVVADTIVVFMCRRTIVGIARELVRAGRSPHMPVAIVRGATHDAQELYTGSLLDVAGLADDWDAAFDDALPVLAIIGDVVALASTLAWRTIPQPLGQRGAA
jgi:uroporphyrin-III C-methyltransferase